MKTNFYSIKSKLVILIISIIIFWIGLGIFSCSNINKIKEFIFLTKSIDQLATNVLQLNSTEKDFLYKDLTNIKFFETGKSKSLEKFQKCYANNQKLAADILINPLVSKNKALIEKLNTTIDELEAYSQIFNEMVLNIHQRGYQTIGLSGDWQQQGQYLYKMVSEFENTRLNEMVLTLSKLEKSYLLGKDSKYIEEIVKYVDEYKLILSGNKTNAPLLKRISEYEKSNLIEELNKYASLAKILLEKDNKIGILKETGLIEEIQNKSIAIETEVSEIVKIIGEEINSSTSKAKTTLTIVILILTISTAIFFYLLLKSINEPLKKIKNYILELVQGKLPENLHLTNKDEISEMSDYLNKFVDNLKEKSNFADEIGKWKLDTNFKPLSEFDTLGNSLLEMKKSLQKANEEDQKHELEEQKRTWANVGLAKFSEILRQNNDNIETLSNNIIQNLVKYLNANQGGLFLYNDDDKNNVYLELVAAFAFDRKKYFEKKIEIGEGLVGTCAIEKQTIYLTEIPEEYISITSGLGDSSPKSLLIVPLKLENNIFGIIEIASFNKFQKYEIEFIERIAESIASALFGVKINARTARLLEQSQKHAVEMAEQEEEMRQNMEELQASQEESARKEAEITGILNAIDSSSLVIEYDMNGKLIEINEKFVKLLETPKEQIIGKNHTDLTSLSKNKEAYEQLWNDLKNGNSKTHIEKINLINGKEVWLNQNYTPILDKEGNPYKILNIAIDITESKIQEKSLENQAKEILRKNIEMKSLSDAVNEAIIKCEYAPDGIILEANDNYTKSIGYTREEIIGKNNRLFLKEDEKKQFEFIWNELSKGKSYKGVIKRTKPTQEELWLMSTFTPVKNEKGNVYKIYFLAQNITERKLKYKLLEEANKEIERLKKNIK